MSEISLDMTSAGSVYSFGSYALDPSKRLVLRDGEKVPLTPKAFDVLCLLVEHRGVVVSKDRLLAAVWPDTVVEESNLAFQISLVRKALGDRSEDPRFIATVPGQGYQFVAPVELLTPPSEVIIEEKAIASITVEEATEGPSRRFLAVGMAAAAALLILVAFFALRSPDRGVADANPVIETIAVLPFKTLLEAERDEALELGMADAMIGRISRLRGIVVRPLTAVRGYGSLDQDALAAGRQLGVEAVLDGTIQRSGNRLRVTARLLRVTDSVQLWEGRFDEQATEIFTLQDRLSSRIAEELSLELSPADRERLARHDTESVEAYQAYSLAVLHLMRVRSDQFREAIRQFERAIELDPGYAAAYAGLADCLVVLPISSDTDGGSFGRGRAAAEKAIALDPHNALAHVALGTEKFWHAWDWDGAERAFRRAIELDPNLAGAHLRLAHLLSNTGRHEEAMREAREALRIDPLSLIANVLTAQFSLQAGEAAPAIRQLERTLAIDPDFWIARLNLGKAFEMQQRYDEALVEYRRARSASAESLEPLAMIGYLQAIRGETADAEKVLEELLATARQRHVPATKIALVYAGLGRRDEAFEWLGIGCEQRDVGMTFLDANPRWRRLADDPRFARIATCVGLPQFRNAAAGQTLNSRHP
jgi:DNA-binding winged helix-turn-helix (wHTH) protein/TolB-like protein/Tfp pilus assembly protein PilF